MAITQSQLTVNLLTYEAYVAEGCVSGRYDIVEGVRLKMPGPSWEHQTIVGNLYTALRTYGQTHHTGRAMISPLDVLVRKIPRLQVRQPDVFFITTDKVRLTEGTLRSGILEAVPELVVEVASDSETENRLSGKLRDYYAIGVSEVWIVRPETQSVELLRRDATGYQTDTVYSGNETVLSRVFPDLMVPVSAMFAE